MTSSRPTPGGSASTISREASTGVTESSSPTQTSVGQSMRASWSTDVEPPEQLHPGRRDVRVPDPASQLLLVRHVRAERGEDPRPLLVSHVVAAAVVAPGQFRDLVAGDAAEALDQPRQVEPGVRRLQHQPRRVAGMSRAVEHRDEAAHRVAEDDRPRDPEDVAERPHVVGAGLERPVRRVLPRRPAVVPQVQVNDLRHGASAARSRA